MKTRNLLYIIINLNWFLIFTSCTTRQTNPIILEDSTVFYPHKTDNYIIPKIRFYRTSRNEQLNGEGNKFTISKNSFVRARIEFDSLKFDKTTSHLFHVDWLDKYEKSVYQKQINFTENDTSDFLRSSISISPEVRDSGWYSLRVYYFRELMAEKKLYIFHQVKLESELKQELNTQTVLCRGISRKTGKAVGIDSVFYFKERRIVKAISSFDNLDTFKNQPLVFTYEWSDSLGNIVYKKEIDYNPFEPIPEISSSISISPDSREAGKYNVRLLLFDEIISENNFQILEKSKIPKIDCGIKISFSKENNTFLKKYDKRVNASIRIDCKRSVQESQEFNIEWVDTKGKVFFIKNISIPKNEFPKNIKSSISIKKRKAGKHILRLSANNIILEKKEFRIK